ncbi:Shedu anti-phage system protein SduA domain-containing protein [Legionella sp. WA2024007413]
MDKIQTESVKPGTSETTPILLDQTSTTALYFHAALHDGGIRGHFYRFKKAKDENLERITEKDFKSLKLHEGVHIELGSEQIGKLYSELGKRRAIQAQKGFEYGENEYIVISKNDKSPITEENLRVVIEQILERNNSDALWDFLKDFDQEKADQITANHIYCKRKKIIDELKERIDRDYSETIGEESWQRWIYRHNWLFGVNYQTPIEKQKINLVGSMPDYLFPTIDNFVDILEIKLPKFDVIEQDKSHPGSWIWSKDSNKAIGQVVNYLNDIERLRYEIEKLIKKYSGKDIIFLKPRAFILIGKSDDWPPEKKEGLKKLNYALHGIEVITYTDLINRGEVFINVPLDL